MEIPPLEWFINGGLALVLLVMILGGVLVPGWIYKKEERARRAAEEKADTLERALSIAMGQLAATGTKAMQALADVAQENREGLRAVRGDVSADPLKRLPGTPPEGARVGE